MLEVFPFGRWNGDAHDYVAIKGKLATETWIEKSSFEKMPGTQSVKIDESLVVNGVYSLPM